MSNITSAAQAHIESALGLDGARPSRRRFRNRLAAAGASYLQNFFMGLLIVGPAIVALYTLWWFINFVDAWAKPFMPGGADDFLPAATPMIGLALVLFVLPKLGIAGAKLISDRFRTIAFEEMPLPPRQQVLRFLTLNLTRLFRSRNPNAGDGKRPQRVGLIEFPAKDIWSIVFVVDPPGEDSGIGRSMHENDLVTVIIPNGEGLPGGSVCLMPRRLITFVEVPLPDAAKFVSQSVGAALKAAAKA